MAGDTPTNDELETAIINAGNNGYEKGKATFSNITSISATMTGNDKDYIEEIELKFSKKIIMEYIYKYFDEKAHIIIYSPKPADLTTSNDIRAILLDEYPKLRNDYFIVSNVHDTYAICVGNNINCQGTVRIQIKKADKLLKGENKNAKSYWDYTIE